MSETGLWLIGLVPSSILYIIIAARSGWRWTWGLCLQQLIILVATCVGLCAIYAPGLFTPMSAANVARLANYCAWLGWILFLAFNLAQRLVLNKLTLDLSLMRINEAKKRMPVVRMLVWGPPANYWNDLTEALALYHAGDTLRADELIERWRADKRMPAPSKEALTGFESLGRVMQSDWSYITQHQGPGIPPQMVARAFAEEHRYSESLQQLKLLSDQPTRVASLTVDLNFVHFFALTGAWDRLQQVLKNCTDRQALPEYARLYWQGRCAAVRGEAEKALNLLALAKSKTPASLSVWLERIDKQMHEQQRILAGLQPPAVQAADNAIVEDGYKTYWNWRLAADVLRPSSTGKVTLVLFWSLLIVYNITYGVDLFRSFLPTDVLMQLAYIKRYAFFYGELNTAVWHGEWWRTITYMFLHGGPAHLLLNAVGLFVFGRTVENVYGSWKFFIIFFGSGISSGLFQLLMLPSEAAVGASGAILGAFGAVIAGLIKLKRVLPPKVRQQELRLMLSIAGAQVVFDQLVNNLAAATDKSGAGVKIAAFAHAGGIIAGFLIGMLLPLRFEKQIDNVDRDDLKG